MSGVLYVVGVPIGNLEDITYRAARVLGEVDLIAAEDTRRARTLLAHYGIETRLVSYHDHNERERAAELIERLSDGESVALISDAGTPAVADPGYTLIVAAAASGIEVAAIPGPSACVAAASISGLPLHDFFYAGFCSPKSARRRRRFKSLASLESTLIFYEGPHRVRAFLEDAEDLFGDRRAVIARELTKVHEETLRGSLSELRRAFEEREPRGEFTILIAGRDERTN